MAAMKAQVKAQCPFLGRELLSKHVALKVAHSGHLNVLFFFELDGISFWLALIPLGH